MTNEITTYNSSKNTYDYFYLLSMFFLTIMIGTYLLAYKFIAIGTFIESAGIFIFPLNYAITDIITEVYGYDKTIKLIKYSFICCLFFSIVIPLLALLPAPVGWPHQNGYDYIFSHVFRFFIANSIGILIGIMLNGYLIAKWRILLRGKHFWLRSIGASALGELITSVIADIIAFFNTVDFFNLIKLMLAIYAVKLIYAVLLAWPNTLIVLHLKVKTGTIDLFENRNIKFNPFENNQLKEQDANAAI